MIPPILAALLAATAATTAAPRPAAGSVETEYARLTIREQIIIRVPMRRMMSPLPPPVAYRDKKADRCQPIGGMAAAVVATRDSVDFIYRGGARIRAELEDACPSLDFDSGFYVAPTPDRRICAGRDAIRARAGGECAIKRFRKLVPDKRAAKAGR